MEEIAKLIERVSLQLIEMQYFSIGVLLYEDGLSNSVLVAHADIVVEGELDGGGGCSALTDLPDDDILPLFLSALFVELEVYSVEVLVY